MSPEKRRGRRPAPRRQHACGRHPLSIASTRVVERSEPLRLVVHDLDGSWQFLDGLPVDVDHLMTTHAHHLFDEFADDLAALVDLPPGHLAERPGPGFPWRVTAHVGG